MSTQSSEANAVLDDEYPMVLIGRDHRVSYANPRAHQLFGYAHGGLHGMSVEQLLAPARRTEVRNIQAVLRGQAPRRWRSLTRQASGELTDVNLGLEPCLDHRGAVVAVKLRCERILRSPPPVPASRAPAPASRAPAPASRPPAPASFEAVSSGTRSIPPMRGRVPNPPVPTSASEPPTVALAVSQPARKSTRAVNPPASTRSSASATRSGESVLSKSGPVAVVRSAPLSQLVLTDDGAEQLETALQLLGWLRQRLEAESGPLGDERERARALIVLNETTELVAQCRCDMKRETKPRVSHG